MKMNPRHWLFHRVLLVEVREIIWFIFVVSALVPLWRDVARADTFHFLAILLPHSPFSTCTTFFFKAPKSSSSNISQTVSFSLNLNPLLHSDKERSTPRPMKNRPLWPLENVFRLIFILNFLRLLLRVEEVPLLLSFSSQMSEQGDFLVSDHPTPLSTPETPRGSLLNVHKSSSQVKKNGKLGNSCNTCKSMA